MSKGALYYFVEQDGRTRQVVNGVVTSLAKKKPLPHAPIGTKEILILWERNITRWAQVRNFSLPMGFVREAALILRNDMIFNNIDRKLFLLIQKFVSRIDASFFYDRYEFLYKGELDFSTYEDNPSDTRVNMSIMEGGNSKLVKANESTEFLIPFDEDAINILMDGVYLYSKAKYSLSEIEDSTSGFASGNKDLKTMSFSNISKEGTSFGVVLFDSAKEEIDGSVSTLEYMASSNNYWAINNGDATVNIHITGTMRFKCTSKTGTVKFSADFKKNDDTQYSIFANQVLTEGQEYSAPFDFTIPLGVGEKLFFFGFFDNSGGGLNLAKIEYQDGGPFLLDYKSKKGTSVIKAFKPLDVYKKLCIKLGIAISAVISTLLASSQIMLSSGDGIRGIDASDVGVKTSLNDFFKAYNVYYMLGFDIRDIVKIERREIFFRTNNPIILGEVAEFKTTIAEDLMYSSIKVGHKEQDIEDTNGKYDFNGNMVFTTPILKGGGKQMDLVSPYKAGPYEIETLRSNLDGKETTDNDRDNEVYVIVCAAAVDSYDTTVSFVAVGNKMTFPLSVKLVKGMRINIIGSGAGNDREYIIQDVTNDFSFQTAVLDVAVTNESDIPVHIEIVSGHVYSLDRSITVTSGVPDPDTIFNVAISPKRLLAAHYRWIRSFCHNYEPGQLVFQQSNRNSDLVAGGITEKANVDIASMGEKLFLPYYHEFKTKVPVDLTETQETDPDAPIMPTWLGDDYTGFIWRAGISPNSDTPQVFKMLSGPNNDLTRLIA